MRIASIDQGTTSTRCLVVDDGGAWHVAAAIRHKQFHPHPGHVEHDGEELIANIRTVLAKAGPVDAVALANQGESCLAWDAKTKEPLSPVIVWQDSRTSADLLTLPADAEAISKRICGLPLDPYFSASKLAWLLKNNSDVKAAYKAGRLRLGTTDAFFLDRLCDNFATDCATASRTGLMDLQTLSWSEELCELHNVPIECLPKIHPVNAGFGMIDGKPLQVSIVDQQAALYGHNCRKPGDCKITFGTGAFLLALTGCERPQTGKLLPTVAWQKNNDKAFFAVEGGVYDAGAALEWARKIGFFTDMSELAGFSGPSAISRGLSFVPAISGLAAPYWDRQAACSFIGMVHATDKRDMVRAILEGIALLTTKLIENTSEIVPLNNTISIDGGLSQNAYFAQFLASASGRTIIVPQMHELTAFGLAELCGVTIEGIRERPAIYKPDDSVSNQDHLLFDSAIQRSCKWHDVNH